MRLLSGIGKGLETATSGLGNVFGELFGGTRKPDSEPETKDVTPERDGGA